jgi:hypothetical protein
MRAQVIASIPSFFGPGDPAIYFQMGRAILHHGVPRVDFMHHFLTSPPAVTHIEDYYEPAFGYLLAAVMLVRGQTPAGAAALSWIFGLLGIALVWGFSRRHGSRVAMTAAAIVAFEPWSILYGGLIMKEATVAVIALLFLELLRRSLEMPITQRRLGALLGLATVGAGLFQYELIPILGLTTTIVLARCRRDALGWYLTVSALAVVTLVGVTWATIGVPISAKYAFFLGRAPGDPDPIAIRRFSGALGPALLPFDYLGTAILTRWYPLLLVLAAVGIRRSTIADRAIVLSFTLALVYLHAVAHDLWARDFIPLTCVLSRPAAMALNDPECWWRRPWGPALAVATLFFVIGAPPLLLWLRGLGFVLTGPWPRIGTAAFASLALFGIFWTIGKRWSNAWATLAIPAAMGIGLAWSFWTELPYPRINLNPQFPDYEIERARRERVCDWIAASFSPGPIIARIPAEVSFYSGFPAIVMPESLRAGTLDRLAVRYGVRYLLVEPGSLPESAIAGSSLTPLGDREACRLFAFRPGTGGEGTRSPVNSTRKSR